MPQDDRPRFVPGSALLQDLHDGAPPGHFTLRWLMMSLRKQSYPGIIFLLAIVAMVPGISMPAGLLLLVPTIQLIARRPMPTFPRWVIDRPLPTDKLSASLKRVIPVLKAVEVAVHPRWPLALTLTKRIVGLVILLLTARLLAWPLPFGNMLPAALISLIALSHLEGDGLILALALATGLIVLAVDALLLYDLVPDLMKISTQAAAADLPGVASFARIGAMTAAVDGG